MPTPNLTDHDRQTIREIQQRIGVEPTGEIDSQTVLAIHETLGIAHKFFARFLGKIPEPQTSGTAG
jgi:hypothetical protein